MQHDCDKLIVVPLCCCRQAVHRFVCKAGFQSCCTLIDPNQFVGIGKTKFAAPDIVHPDRSVILEPFMAHDLPAHDGYIIGGGVMRIVVRKSRAIDEMRVLKSELGSSCVHSFSKCRFRTGNVLRHRDRTVVRRRDHDAFEHFVHGHALTGFQIYLAASHLRSSRACSHGIG